MSGHGKMAVVGRKVLAGEPVTEVHYEAPVNPTDSGFVIYSDADPFDPQVEDVAVVCLHCLVGDYPSSAPGMDAAVKAKADNPEAAEVVVHLEGGAWVVGKHSEKPA